MVDFFHHPMVVVSSNRFIIPFDLFDRGIDGRTANRNQSVDIARKQDDMVGVDGLLLVELTTKTEEVQMMTSRKTSFLTVNVRTIVVICPMMVVTHPFLVYRALDMLGQQPGGSK